MEQPFPFIGHRKEDGTEQSLSAHLEGTAQLAAEFGCVFCIEGHARRTALLHDVGKCASRVQQRLRFPDQIGKTDHSTAGAKSASAMGDPFAALAIAGHHSGLLDYGSPIASTKSDGTFFGRMKSDIDETYRSYLPELPLESGQLWPQWLNRARPYAQAMYTRMLFSCLVDADFLDTEQFMRDKPAPRSEGFHVIYAKI